MNTQISWITLLALILLFPQQAPADSQVGKIKKFLQQKEQPFRFGNADMLKIPLGKIAVVNFIAGEKREGNVKSARVAWVNAKVNYDKKKLKNDGCQALENHPSLLVEFSARPPADMQVGVYFELINGTANTKDGSSIQIHSPQKPRFQDSQLKRAGKTRVLKGWASTKVRTFYSNFPKNALGTGQYSALFMPVICKG